MIQVIRVEAVILKFASKAVGRQTAAFFPSVLKQAAQSYLSWFVFGLIALASAQLYNPSASQNDRIYAAFVILLSFLYTVKTILFSIRKLKVWLEKRNGLEFRAAASNPTTFAVVIGLIAFVMLSLIPPILIFKFQDLVWAERMCLAGLLLSAIIVAVLAILSYNSSRIRSIVGDFPLLLRRLPLVNSSGIAGRLYHESCTVGPGNPR